MTEVSQKDIQHLQQQIEDLKKTQEKNYQEQKETNEKNHDELKRGLVRASDKLDLALARFETKEDSRREIERLEKKIETLTGRLWGLASAVLVSFIGLLASLFRT